MPKTRCTGGFRTALSLIIAAMACPFASAATVGIGAGEVNPDHILVRNVPGTLRSGQTNLDVRAGVVAVKWHSGLVPGLRLVQVAPGQVDAALAAFRADPTVKYAEPDRIRRALAQSTPYGITMVNGPLVWPTSVGAGTIVADLDTGIDIGHPDLPSPSLTASFISGETVQDGHGHGTHTAGTITALNNSLGVVGVAPAATLIVGKVLSNSGSGADSGVAAGIDWAVANGAKVINMSLGGPDNTQALQDACDAALAAGVLVVAASGNDNSASPFYPAAYSSVLSVSAVDSSKSKASFSNFGPLISLAAPGVSVQSTYPGALANWSGVDHVAFALTGTGPGVATGNAIFCGFGESAAAFPPSVAGNIAHIRRGSPNATSVSFQTKAVNAAAAGAVGVIISNNVAGTFTGTLNTTVAIPVVSVSQADGTQLQAASGTPASIGATGAHTYSFASGTSMACPHVVGVAALLFAAQPSATPAQVRAAMEQSAEDLGVPGRDDYFGYGLVNAQAALTLLQSTACVADFNRSGSVSVQDLFDFLAAWFASSAAADFNNSGSVTVQDLFDFLGAWFTPC